MDETANLRDPRDPRTLLCERCGYVLEGLPTSGPCPECAEPIEASLPARRVGSAWQRAPGVRGWWKTGIEYVRQPTALMRGARIDAGAVRLLLINATISGLVAAAATGSLLVCVRAMSPSPRSRAEGVILGQVADLSGTNFAIVHITLAVLVCGLALLASWIEVEGIRLFGRRRQWRITRYVALTVCAHASYGWIGGALVVAPPSLLLVWVTATAGSPPIGAIEVVMSWVFGVAALLGILFFEVRVYTGMRACKYANAPRDNAAP